MKKKLFFSIFLLNFFWIFAQTNCGNALNLTLGTHTVNTLNGTAPTILCGLSSGAGTAGIWYQYTPTQNANVTVSTAIGGQNVDTRVIVYSGSCVALTCVASNDDYAGNAARVSFVANAGTTYTIAFDNKWSNSGFNFSLPKQLRNPTEFHLLHNRLQLPELLIIV